MMTTRGILAFQLATCLSIGMVVGCGTKQNPREEPTERTQAVVAWAFSAPAAGGEIEPDETHQRADCPTNGWITHGDGHQTRCPSCRPAYSEETPVEMPRCKCGCPKCQYFDCKCTPEKNCGDPRCHAVNENSPSVPPTQGEDGDGAGGDLPKIPPFPYGKSSHLVCVGNNSCRYEEYPCAQWSDKTDKNGRRVLYVPLPYPPTVDVDGDLWDKQPNGMYRARAKK